MKVLILAKPGVFDKTGGDRIQIEQTAAHLKNHGVKVDFGTGYNHDFSLYDLIHVFQLDWNPYCYFQIKEAKKNNKPVVFSTIHHSVKELKRFDDEYVFDFRRISKKLFSDQFHRDLFKELYKALLNPADLKIVIYAIVHGLKKMYQTALEMADVVLVQTALEADDLKSTFEVDFKWQIVKNGVGDAYLNFKPHTAQNPFSFTDYLLCVGRVEPRKNQLNVIKAVKMLRDEDHLDLKLVLIGPRSEKKHFEFYSQLDHELKKSPWVIHIPKVNYDEMPTYYHFAKVGVSASWFETTGLTSLEALFCGANAVASGERARQYLGDNAYYCDPGDVESIKSAIRKAYVAPRPQILDTLRKEYTWEKAAQDTYKVYNELLKL